MVVEAAEASETAVEAEFAEASQDADAEAVAAEVDVYKRQILMGSVPIDDAEAKAKSGVVWSGKRGGLREAV